MMGTLRESSVYWRHTPCAYTLPDEKPRMNACLLLLVLAAEPAPTSTAPLYSAELIFPLHAQHNHAPGIAVLPGGELFVTWYRGSGERSADDVAVYGSRKKPGVPTRVERTA